MFSKTEFEQIKQEVILKYSKDFSISVECLNCDHFNKDLKDPRLGYRCCAGNCVAVQKPELWNEIKLMIGKKQ
jgi:hypothetical protein